MHSERVTLQFEKRNVIYIYAVQLGVFMDTKTLVRISNNYTKLTPKLHGNQNQYTHFLFILLTGQTELVEKHTRDKSHSL